MILNPADQVNTFPGARTMPEAQTKSALKFPCEFPIKVIGWNQAKFEEEVILILQKHVPDLAVEKITTRLSSGSKYRSMTSTFTAQSREQLDGLYIELTAHRLVLWVL
jgi:uncharacterized protein